MGETKGKPAANALPGLSPYEQQLLQSGRGSHNGFTYVPVAPTGTVQKLLGRRPPENAFVEIRNLLASAPFASVDRTTVQAILERHRLSVDAAKPKLADIYRAALGHCATDGALSPEEDRFLSRLADAFELTAVDVSAERRNVLEGLYRAALVDALGDGQLSSAEREGLDAVARSFAIPSHRVQAIYNEEAIKVLQLFLNALTSDGRITTTEDQELRERAEHFGVTIRHTEEGEAILARMRELGRIEAGELPVVHVPLALQRGEHCHVALHVGQHEIRTQTTRFNYLGLTGSVKIVGPIRWRIGSMGFDRIQRDVMTHIDNGDLYLTNRRVLFDGSKKNTSITLAKIVRFTIYSDGLQIQKGSGLDQFFIGSGDWERAGAVLEQAIRKDRA